jgi:hypothetical protein
MRAVAAAALDLDWPIAAQRGFDGQPAAHAITTASPPLPGKHGSRRRSDCALPPYRPPAEPDIQHTEQLLDLYDQLTRLPHQFSYVNAFRDRLTSIATMLECVLVASGGA